MACVFQVAIISLALAFVVQSTGQPETENQVEFYDGTDFQGLIWQGPPAKQKGCMQLPYRGLRMASSVVTTTCVMVYTYDNCHAESRYPSFVLLPGKYSDLSGIAHRNTNVNNKIVSFRECIEDVGVNKPVHVTLHDGNYDLVEYFNMKKCINLPLYSFTTVLKVKNYGHCVKLFNSTDCNGDSLTVQGGTSAESEHLRNGNFEGRTKSLSPCHKLI